MAMSKPLLTEFGIYHRVGLFLLELRCVVEDERTEDMYTNVLYQVMRHHVNEMNITNIVG